MPVTGSPIESLIGESRELERVAAGIQGENQLLVDDAAVDAFISQYHAWYAQALDALPEGFKERFRDAFEGGTFTAKIKEFLRAPGDVSPLYDPSPENVFPYWTYPFDTAFRGPLLEQRQILTEAQRQVEGPGEASRDLLLVERICRHFPEFLEPLANRGRNRQPFIVEDEYDLQVLLEGVLRLFFDDVRPEDFAPERAGGRSRVDFLLKSEQIVIETKMTRPGLGARKLGEELIVDIERYKSHPDCGALVALVYDPEKQVQNRRALEHDLSRKHDGLLVRVYIVQ